MLCSGEGLQRRGGTLAVLQGGLGYQVSVSCLSKAGLGGRATRLRAAMVSLYILEKGTIFWAGIASGEWFGESAGVQGWT